MRRARRGFSMMEVTLSVLLVGVVLVAAMNTVAGAKAAQAQMSERAIASVLCESMMAEILAQSYADPMGGPTSFGPGGSEADAGLRAPFNDVDDYLGWASTPPEDKDGAPIAWAGGLTRRVTVECVRASDLSPASPDGECLKRVTVSVWRNKKVIYELESYVSPLWPDPREDEG